MKNLQGSWPILVFAILFFIIPLSTLFKESFDPVFIVVGLFGPVIAGLLIAASQENATHLLTDGREVIVDRDSAAREGLESMVDTTMARADEVAKLTRRPESLVASE